MADFSAAEICAATGARAAFDAGRRFSGVSTDTRTVEPGMLFVALRGERFDGHDFLAEALRRGAAGVLVDGRAALPELPGASAFVSADTLAAYQALAAAHRARFSIPVVAVTGSNGKTTTKDLIAAALGSRLRVLKTQANFNNEIGLPRTLLELSAAHEAAVVEMGMRGLGQIRALARIARPTIGVVTNVSETHVELLGSIDNIARAKGELAEALTADGCLLLNADDPRVAAMRARAKCPVRTFGFAPDADVRAERVRMAEGRTSFECVAGGWRRTFVLPLLGRHNVCNALAAIAVGTELGLSPEELQAGVSALQPTPMRLETHCAGGVTVINDAYNASPASMRAAIEVLAEAAPGRKLAALGDMLELGGEAEALHAAVGELLAARGADAVVTVGKLAARIAERAAALGVAAYACEDHAQAAARLQSLLRSGDTVLVKGSRGMRMEKVAELLLAADALSSE